MWAFDKCKAMPYINCTGLILSQQQSTNRKSIMSNLPTKKALATAHANFAKYPSAAHWRALEHAMYAHQAATNEQAHQKVIAQADRLLTIMSA